MSHGTHFSLFCVPLAWPTFGGVTRNGGKLDLPAPGFKGNETPKLNAGVARREAYRRVKHRLDEAYDAVLRLIGELDDRELYAPGVFGWTGKHAVCKLIALNTARE